MPECGPAAACERRAAACCSHPALAATRNTGLLLRHRPEPPTPPLLRGTGTDRQRLAQACCLLSALLETLCQPGHRATAPPLPAGSAAQQARAQWGKFLGPAQAGRSGSTAALSRGDRLQSTPPASTPPPAAQRPATVLMADGLRLRGLPGLLKSNGLCPNRKGAIWSVAWRGSVCSHGPISGHSILGSASGG